MKLSVMARPLNGNCFILENGSLPVTSPASIGITTDSPLNSPRASSSPSRTTVILSAGSPWRV
jgi:hypothetical protein